MRKMVHAIKTGAKAILLLLVISPLFFSFFDDLPVIDFARMEHDGYERAAVDCPLVESGNKRRKEEEKRGNKGKEECSHSTTTGLWGFVFPFPCFFPFMFLTWQYDALSFPFFPFPRSHSLFLLLSCSFLTLQYDAVLSPFSSIYSDPRNPFRPPSLRSHPNIKLKQKKKKQTNVQRSERRKERTQA